MKKLSKGFSLMECIVAISLIVFITIVAYTATIVATNIQAQAMTDLSLSTSIEAFQNAFKMTFYQVSKSNEEQQKDAFISQFNDYLKHYLFVDEKNEENESKLSIYEYENSNYKTYSYDYLYTCSKYSIHCSMNIRTYQYYLKIEGYQNHKKLPSYTYEEVY